MTLIYKPWKAHLEGGITLLRGLTMVINHPWTPKPWKMKVLNPNIWVLTPKNEGFGFPWHLLNRMILQVTPIDNCQARHAMWWIFHTSFKYFLEMRQQTQNHMLHDPKSHMCIYIYLYINIVKNRFGASPKKIITLLPSTSKKKNGASPKKNTHTHTFYFPYTSKKSSKDLLTRLLW